MKIQEINEKFIEFQNYLEGFGEEEIKNMLACIQALWLTNDESRQKEALKILARLASNSCHDWTKKRKIDLGNTCLVAMDLSKVLQ